MTASRYIQSNSFYKFLKVCRNFLTDEVCKTLKTSVFFLNFMILLLQPDLLCYLNDFQVNNHFRRNNQYQWRQTYVRKYLSLYQIFFHIIRVLILFVTVFQKLFLFQVAIFKRNISEIYIYKNNLYIRFSQLASK